MVQLASDKQVVLFVFLSLLIHLNLVQVGLHVKMLGPTSAAWTHLMEGKLLWLIFLFFFFNLKHKLTSEVQGSPS